MASEHAVLYTEIIGKYDAATDELSRDLTETVTK